jgi:hypothetical protein
MLHHMPQIWLNRSVLAEDLPRAFKYQNESARLIVEKVSAL